MLVKLLKYLHGYVKIQVSGYSPERFLNLCNANGILLWGVESQEFIYEMFISIKDYKKLRPYARKTRTKIILLEKHGFPFFLHRFRKRKIFFAGMFTCLILVYGLSLFVWNIHFEGNVSQKDEELLEYLESLDIKHGVLKSQIRCETIETSLRTKYPNMLWVSAEMRGTRIVIQIKENTDEDIISKIEVTETEDSSIITEASGVIESMIVRQGTPVVSIGEEVTAGQILVEGYYIIKNDAGEIVRYEGVEADADITVLSTEQYKDVISLEYKTKKFTKKKRLGVKINIFDKEFEYMPQIPFIVYDVVSDKKEVHVTENFYLPLSVELFWYLEYEPETNLYTEEELKEQINERFLNKYKNILQKGVQIIEKGVKIESNGKLCEVCGNVTLRIPATKKIPVTIPEVFSETLGEGEH